MRRHAALVRLALAAIALLGYAACGAKGTTTSGAVGSTSSVSGSGGSGASTANGTGGDLLSVGAGPSCEEACSGDLKKVTCDGVVTKECGPDEACLGGMCTTDVCGAANVAKSSYGCDYWALKPDIISAVRGACFAAFIANTWSSPVHVSVEYKGQPLQGEFIRIPQGQGASLTYQPYDPVAGLAVGEVAALFLAHDSQGQGLKCPFQPAVDAPAGVVGTGFGSAFHITTDRPVVAYSIMPFGGASAQATSASLLLPTSAWDTNYVAVSAFPKAQTFGPAVPSIDILARENDTTVTLLPGVSVQGGGGVASTPANQPLVYKLAAGQYLQIAQTEELTGAPIQSDKPVGVWGAASCLSVPVDVPFCDSAHQQIPPVRALGSRYALVRYRNRAAAMGQEETPPWRLVGAVDGTALTWKPVVPPGAPTFLQSGEVVVFEAAGPFVVSSQDADHPFYLGQYMTGSERYGGHEGDPEWVNVVPVDQYLDSYVFFTDPTYSETSLVVVRQKNLETNAFEPVTLDCLGPLQGWQPIVDDLEYTRVDLVTGAFQDVGGCSNGRREMKSVVPFGVTVWGWGTLGVTPSTHDVSYAYPAGASVKAVNQVVVPPTPK
ncbi:MAG: IgGFc-binding protein [Deltaproteobacteria bacterium]|nr:IgGFc-binding protein [Deltaproteobacteria bacterium]